MLVRPELFTSDLDARRFFDLRASLNRYRPFPNSPITNCLRRDVQDLRELGRANNFASFFEGSSHGRSVKQCFTDSQVLIDRDLLWTIKHCLIKEEGFDELNH